MDVGSESTTSTWNMCGYNFPRSEVVFITQMILIYTITITALVNLTNGPEHHTLWVALLSSCLGYTLPNPKIKRASNKLRPVFSNTAILPEDDGQ